MSTIEPLPWDSEFFEIPIARLRAEQLTRETLARADSECEQAAIRCLYALVSASDPPTIQRLFEWGYRWVDIRLTLMAEISDAFKGRSLDPRIRKASKNDIVPLRAIASTSHTDGRFYSDPDFPRDRCDAFYAQWIENSVNGYEDAVWVIDDEWGPAGYVTCKLRPEGRGQIGLFAVAARARGKGFGRRLIDAAKIWFATQHCREVDVVTQGANIAAQRIYQRNGFVTKDVQVWFHKWFVKS